MTPWGCEFICYANFPRSMAVVPCLFALEKSVDLKDNAESNRPAYLEEFSHVSSDFFTYQLSCTEPLLVLLSKSTQCLRTQKGHRPTSMTRTTMCKRTRHRTLWWTPTWPAMHNSQPMPKSQCLCGRNEGLSQGRTLVHPDLYCDCQGRVRHRFPGGPTRTCKWRSFLMVHELSAWFLGLISSSRVPFSPPSISNSATSTMENT